MQCHNLPQFGVEPISDCKFCVWVRERMCADCKATCDRFWNASSDWEYADTGYFSDWDKESEADRAVLEEARELNPSDPASAFALYKKLAKSGCATAMFHVGLHLERGIVSDSDLDNAIEWYGAGLDAGSWTSALSYARLVGRRGNFEECDKILTDGAEAGIATAYYVLAKCRYARNPGRQTAQEIRPLLEKAIAQGHPGAEFFLSELMTKGKFGFGNIFAGMRLGTRCLDPFKAENLNHPGRELLQASA